MTRPSEITRRQALRALAAGCAAPGALAASLARAAQPRADVRAHSDFRLEYSFDRDDLVGDLLHGERGDPHRESHTPHHEWYSHHIRRHYGAWGPAARRYAPLEGLHQRNVQWLRERVIATAARFIGYDYQHHHIPDWNPPAHWPWKHCCAGHNGKGVDCSNFTSFVYNQGFGIHMSSGIGQQSRQHTAFERDGYGVPLHTIELPKSYRERVNVLRTGDLLFIRHRTDMQVSHVVLWVGPIGQATGGEPLILDSHGGDVVDDHGQAIPCGIHLRPFREGSWYNRCASHAHRIFGGRS